MVYRLLIASNFRDWKDLRGLVQPPATDRNTFYSIYNRKCSSLWELPVTEPIFLKISHTLRRFQNIAFLLTSVSGHCNDERKVWFVKREKIQLGLDGTALTEQTFENDLEVFLVSWFLRVWRRFQGTWKKRHAVWFEGSRDSKIKTSYSQNASLKLVCLILPRSSG